MCGGFLFYVVSFHIVCVATWDALLGSQSLASILFLLHKMQEAWSGIAVICKGIGRDYLPSYSLSSGECKQGYDFCLLVHSSSLVWVGFCCR